MSGGVDSSVAAALLHEQGYDVTGIFFKPWQPKNSGAFCNWQQDRQDAMSVAAMIGIKFKTWDFSKEYGKAVTQYMIDSYQNGLTPNPDVMCNKEIKFGIFLEKALAEGADYIATGHYARLKYNKKVKTYSLMTAVDSNKDQTYFLYTLTQKELRHTLFPIGDYLKPQVRKLAKKHGLLTYDKKDSQGVCFVGQLDMKEFLKRYIKPKTGKVILLETGESIGTHDGVYYYTIGQRHGLNLGKDGGPYYVARKDLKKNIVYVTKFIKNLGAQDIQLNQITTTTNLKLPKIAQAKIRYRSSTIPAHLAYINNDRVALRFSNNARAIAAGQSIVFYKGNKVLGGGVVIKS